MSKLGIKSAFRYIPVHPSDWELLGMKWNGLHYYLVKGVLCLSFMSKLGIKSAFRNIPVHPSDWELLGMKWNGLYYFDPVLPFGLRSAPFLFDQFSCMIEWIIKAKLGIPDVIHILDVSFLLPSPHGQIASLPSATFFVCSQSLMSLLLQAKPLPPPPAWSLWVFSWIPTKWKPASPWTS